ncbi:DUF4124 domain-containing protein [Burkholderiaceae bacterium DAT-1]|nr:DUF4124 domain-containing protein [Burkholderiaceae bacterium DAT-1]
MLKYLLLMACLSSAYADTIYRCTEKGKVTLQQTPCPVTSKEKTVNLVPNVIDRREGRMNDRATAERVERQQFVQAQARAQYEDDPWERDRRERERKAQSIECGNAKRTVEHYRATNKISRNSREWEGAMNACWRDCGIYC